MSGPPSTSPQREPADRDPSRRAFEDVDREWLGIRFIVVLILVIAAVIALFAARFVIGGGLFVIAGIWLAVVLIGRARDDRQPIAVAESADSVRRVLVLAHEGLSGAALDDAIKKLAADHDDVHVRVLVPAQASTLDKLAGDVDGNISDAEGGGERIAAGLRDLGVEADAVIGDADSDQALEDVLATYAADEIIVVNPSESEMDRTEQAATGRARSHAPIPVTELNV